MSQYKQERDIELIKRVKQALALPHIHNMNEAIIFAINNECSRFYVSYEDAWRYVQAKEQNKKPNRCTKRNQSIMECIYNRYIKRKKLYPEKKDEDNFSDVIFSPAPSFYLTYMHAKRLFGKARKMLRYSHT